MSKNHRVRTRDSLPGPDPFNDVLAALGTEEVADVVVSVAFGLLRVIIARHRLRFSALSTSLPEEAMVDRVWECYGLDRSWFSLVNTQLFTQAYVPFKTCHAGQSLDQAKHAKKTWNWTLETINYRASIEFEIHRRIVEAQ